MQINTHIDSFFENKLHVSHVSGIKYDSYFNFVNYYKNFNIKRSDNEEEKFFIR